MSNNNNAPFVSTQNFPAVAGVSTSPFTDQRAVIAGGGGGGGGTGNMEYDNGDDSINTKAGDGTLTKIIAIDQGANFFKVENNVGSLTFDNLTGNVSLAHDSNDPGNLELIAEATTAGNGNIILKTETVGQTGAGNLIGTVSGLTQITSQGGISLTSVNDNISLSASADISLLPSQNLFIESGDDIDITSLAGSVNFSTNDINFDLNSINPTYQFRNGEYYRFNGTPASADQILTVSGGLGDVTSPWLLEWTDTPVTYDDVNFTFNRKISNVETPITTYNWGNGNGVTFSLNGSATSQPVYCQWTNNPGATSGVEVLRHFGTAGQDGSIANPFTLTWQAETTGGGTANSNLVLSFDTASSSLILSDPVDNLPVISTVQVVSGRTVLIDDIVVSGTSEVSVIGLSNVTFPPIAIPQLIGNNPPLVAFPNQLGVSSWFPGASFRAIIAGTTTNLSFLDQGQCRVYSNRGVATQNILNTFTTDFTGVSGGSSLGWKWVINFTCRSINVGGVLGVIATNSEFTYTDSTFLSEAYGFVVSNVNSSFDTNVTQYLDFTIDFLQSGNGLVTNLCTIERIF